MGRGGGGGGLEAWVRGQAGPDGRGGRAELGDVFVVARTLMWPADPN